VQLLDLNCQHHSKSKSKKAKALALTWSVWEDGTAQILMDLNKSTPEIL
jgi:hypothetical protein